MQQISVRNCLDQMRGISATPPQNAPGDDRVIVCPVAPAQAAATPTFVIGGATVRTETIRTLGNQHRRLGDFLENSLKLWLDDTEAVPLPTFPLRIWGCG